MVVRWISRWGFCSGYMLMTIIWNHIRRRLPVHTGIAGLLARGPVVELPFAIRPSTHENDNLTDASGEGGEVHEYRAPGTSDRVLRHRQQAEAAALRPGRASSSSLSRLGPRPGNCGGWRFKSPAFELRAHRSRSDRHFLGLARAERAARKRSRARARGETTDREATGFFFARARAIFFSGFSFFALSWTWGTRGP